jgi:hypothetical protein
MAARRKISLSCSSNRVRFFSSRSSLRSDSFSPGRAPSSTPAFFKQMCRVASEIPKSLAIWLFVLRVFERLEHCRRETQLDRP